MEPLVERKHPVYWFDDGSLILDVSTYQFKVHHTLVSRHSRFLSALPAKAAQNAEANGSAVPHEEETPVMHLSLGSEKEIKGEDVEALLRHLYHDVQLGKDSTFEHIASLLRVSSPHQLDYPALHKSAADVFQSMFPTDPASFTHDHPLYDALPLATQFNLKEARKAILYSLVTTTEFDVSDTNVDVSITNARDAPLVAATSVGNQAVATLPATVSNGEAPRKLATADSQICTTLMTRLIENFTPNLFTAPAASHMQCTDVFAGTWMPLVIKPALENDGVYKPLETLQRIKKIKWEEHGLCSSCLAEKIEEWTEEQRNIWSLIDSWLENK